MTSGEGGFSRPFVVLHTGHYLEEIRAVRRSH